MNPRSETLHKRFGVRAPGATHDHEAPARRLAPRAALDASAAQRIGAPWSTSRIVGGRYGAVASGTRRLTDLERASSSTVVTRTRPAISM